MTEQQKLYILLGDDDGEDQELFKEALEQQVPNVVVATVWNGQEILSYLEQCPDQELPNVIVLDYKMPILSGAEVLDRLARDDRYAAIPKVVWSTSSQREYIDECLKKGAVEFFTKPNNPSELRKIAHHVLSFCQPG